MWRHQTIVVCVSLSLLAASGAAGFAEETNPCDGAESNLAMNECLAKAYRSADKELNVVWKQVMRSVDGADYLTPEQRGAWKKELREAQRAWVQFKEHDCNGAVLYEWWGGTGAGGAISSCLLSNTEARTKDLKQRYLDR
jgi:uncharacterized protein YecT (DUF1311 family)